MTSPQIRILAVVSNQRLLAKIEGLMRRRTLEVHHVSSGAGALVLAGNLPYHLVIVESPLPDLEFRDLLGAMRALDSLSDQAGFLVLAADDRAGSAPAELAARAAGAIRVLPAAAEEIAIHQAVSALLGVAARRTARLLVEVEVQLEEGPSRRLYQSQNLSSSGILLRGGRRLEPGSRVRFELSLPGDEPLAGHALVVRHTGPGEKTAGTALRFLDLGAAEKDRLREFVYAGLAAPSEPRRAAGSGR